MKYLRVMLATVAFLLVLASPAWGQNTTSTATTGTEETTVAPTTQGNAGTGTAADDQYNDGGAGNNDDGGGDVDNPNDVIDDTTSKKPLPNTGGVPLLGLAVCALALAGVGFSVLRISTRHDR